jgi:hypothetical protein
MKNNVHYILALKSCLQKYEGPHGNKLEKNVLCRVVEIRYVSYYYQQRCGKYVS